jgi:predicted nucleic acid-binding protein
LRLGVKSLSLQLPVRPPRTPKQRRKEGWMAGPAKTPSGHDGRGSPPAVVTEVLSANPSDAKALIPLPVIRQLETLPLYWERAARTRHILLSKRLKARLPDALIAQSCIDHDVALITRDTDF